MSPSSHLTDEQKHHLLPATQHHALQRLKGQPHLQGHSWERFLPTSLRPEQMDLVRSLPPLTQTQAEIARHMPLQQLHSWHQQHLNWLKTWNTQLEVWARTQPANFERAQAEAHKFMHSYFKGVDTQSKAWQMAVHTRMCAHLQMAVHLTGTLTTKGDFLRIRSSGIKAQQKAWERKSTEFRHLDNLKTVPTGIPNTLEFTPRKTPATLESAQVIYDRFFEEFSSASPIFREKDPDIRWTLNHTLHQLIETQVPHLGQTATQIRQKGGDIETHYQFIPSSADFLQWYHHAERHLEGFNQLTQGIFDAQLLPYFQFHTHYGMEFEKLVQNECIRAFRDTHPQSYGPVTVQAFQEADPQTFAQLTPEELPKIKSMGLDENLLNSVRENVYNTAIETLQQAPPSIKQIETKYLREREVNLYVLQSDPTPDTEDPRPRITLPVQKHPIFSNARSTSACYPTYTACTVPLLETVHQTEPFLSQAHYTNLCIESGKGVLPEAVVGMQGIHTTFDTHTIARAYAHFEERNIRRSKSFAAKITSVQETVGTLLIPYLFRGGQAGEAGKSTPAPTEVNIEEETRAKGIPMVRIRTNTQTTNLAKYYTPSFKALRKVNPNTPVREIPLYLYAPFISERARQFNAQRLIYQALQRQGRHGPEWETFGHQILEALGYGQYKDGLDNTDLPVLAIEGEKKCLAVNQMQDFAFLQGICKGFEADKPDDQYLKQLQPIPMMLPVGTIGVWLTYAPKGQEHVLRPEIHETLTLHKRTFIIGHDNDGAQKVEVAASAATAARVLHRDFNVTPLYWHPPEGPGKGFDDWIEVMAGNQQNLNWEAAVSAAYLQAHQTFNQYLHPLRSDLNYKDIQQETGNLQDFITHV